MSTLRWKNFKIQQSAVILGLCLRKTQGNHMIIVKPPLGGKELSLVFEKAPFSKGFSSTQKRIANIFKFLWFEEHFQMLRFHDELVWMVGLTVEIKLCFQISLA